MWDLIVSVPDHCLSFYFESLDEDRIRWGGSVEFGGTERNCLVGLCSL